MPMLKKMTSAVQLIEDRLSRKECSCPKCIGACRRKPGWFLPAELDTAADLLGMTIEQFFRTHLAVDWWVSNPTIFVVCPAIVGESPGDMYPGDPYGICCLLDEHGSCRIYGAHPYECRMYHHDDTNYDIDNRHYSVALAWCGHQRMVHDLLGKEPRESRYHDKMGGIYYDAPISGQTRIR